jgi:hypothetical protein
VTFWVEANGQDLLTRRDIVTDRQIRLARDRDMIEPDKLFFRSGSTVAAAHSLKKADQNLRWRKHRKTKQASLLAMGAAAGAEAYGASQGGQQEASRRIIVSSDAMFTVLS